MPNTTRPKPDRPTNEPLLPSPPLFDHTATDGETSGRCLEWPELEDIELAPNARRKISPDGITRLAEMLMRTGQIEPGIGYRPDPEQRRVVLYAGQRRLLAARASDKLAGTPGFESLAPVHRLMVLMLDHEPAPEEIRRIQAQENHHEDLTIPDQQDQFADCWQARAGLREDDRIAVVCADLGIDATKAHNLKRQLTLPDAIRHRVAEHPAGDQLSITLANRLAEMHTIAPELTDAVAARISSRELQDKAIKDLGAFVHRTLVEEPNTYAVRIDDGTLLDGHDLVTRAHRHLRAEARPQLAKLLDCEPDKLDHELETLATNARNRALKIPIDRAVRDRARNGRYAYAHDRGRDFAASIWVIDPVFMIDLAHQHLTATDNDTPAQEETFFGTAGLDNDELRDARAADREAIDAWRKRQADATRSNLGLGLDLRSGLMDLSHKQLTALRDIVCHLIAHQYRDVIAYGAGWSDNEHQHPVGDTTRLEPDHPDAIIAAELERALKDRDPLHGIAQLLTRWAAAFVLDPDGIPRTKTLGHERMARKLQDALPGGTDPLRDAVWEFMRPMLSPALVELNRDTFIPDHSTASTVTLDTHRAPSDLSDLDLSLD